MIRSRRRVCIRNWSKWDVLERLNSKWCYFSKRVYSIFEILVLRVMIFGLDFQFFKLVEILSQSLDTHAQCLDDAGLCFKPQWQRPLQNAPALMG